MRREVSAHLEVVVSGTATLVFSIEANVPAAELKEETRLTLDGRRVEPTRFADHQGSRLQRLDCDAGRVVLDYRATVLGQSRPATADPVDWVTFLRPSRYCESDALAPTAVAEFGDLQGQELLAAVAGWVHDRLEYVSGSSLPTDGAVRTLLARQGVCRDFAHLTIALLRARDVPARLVSVYAPGLAPMDFHAVCEAWVEPAWHVVDATWLAPRQTLVRIATGRDAADTAFLTSHGAPVTLEALQVSAVADELPSDDWNSCVELT